MVLERLEARKGSTSSNQLMAEASLILFELVVVVDLLIVLFVLVCRITGSVSASIMKVESIQKL
jgi:hypothetical protein